MHYSQLAEDEIYRLIKGVLERINPITTEISRTSLMVMVVKGDEHVRICGNFESTNDPYISPAQHSFHDLKTLSQSYIGRKQFTTLDLKYAYFQLDVENYHIILSFLSCWVIQVH